MGSIYTDNLIDEDEVPELTEEDAARMVPFSQLPQELQEKLLSINRGPVTFRLIAEKVPAPASES